MKRFFITLCFLLIFAACDEAPLFEGNSSEALNNPIHMALIPGTEFGVLVNANVNLTQETGSLVGVNLASRTVLYETSIPLQNFAGQVIVDDAAQRLYVSDRGNDAVLVFSYKIPGVDGLPISFESVDVPDPAERTSNGLDVDDDPFGLLLLDGTSKGDVLLVTNSIDGTVAIAKRDSLEVPDLDPDDDEYVGFPLLSAANFDQEDQRPGRGAKAMILDNDTGLIYITSTLSNQIYILNPNNLSVEAMLDLSSIAGLGDTRDIAFDGNGLAYIAHRGLRGVVVLDISDIEVNGVEGEVLAPNFIRVLPVGEGPEAVEVSQDNSRLLVTNQSENSIDVFLLSSLEREKRIYLSETGPSELIADPGRGVVYVMNFISDTITVLDGNTGAFVESFQ